MYSYNGTISVPNVTEASKAREYEMLRQRNAKLAQPIACYEIAWTTVKGVDALAIDGMNHIVAVPNSGRRTSAKFDVIDLEANEFLCQLTKGEVYGWLISKAKALEVPFNAVC